MSGKKRGEVFGFFDFFCFLVFCVLSFGKVEAEEEVEVEGLEA